MKKITLLLLLSSMILVSCKNVMRNIPSGFVGKKLTPTGWDKRITEAGQVDIGEVDNDGTATSLVLLEVTTTTIKESFLDANNGDSTEPGDHRIRTKDGTPLSVDIYVLISIPNDPQVQDGIFSMITPDPYGDRISVIHIEKIYNQFAKMTIRGNTRSIFAKYDNADSVMQNYNKINTEISMMIIDVVKKSKAPFNIIDAQLSNVKEDDIILQSKNKLVAAKNEVQAIQMVGDAIRTNPYYLEARRLDVLEKVGTSNKSSLIIMDTKNAATIAIPPSK